MKDKLKRLIGDKRFFRVILIAAAVGVGLILLSGFFGTSEEKQSGESFNVTTYSTKIETDLEQVLSQISGVGKTKVLLSMENSVEYVYLKDSTTKTKEVQPIIRGVLVVCDGGDDPVITERVTTAVTRALGISAAKVCVTKLSE